MRCTNGVTTSGWSAGITTNKAHVWWGGKNEQRQSYNAHSLTSNAPLSLLSFVSLSLSLRYLLASQIIILAFDLIVGILYSWVVGIVLLLLHCSFLLVLAAAVVWVLKNFYLPRAWRIVIGGGKGCDWRVRLWFDFGSTLTFCSTFCSNIFSIDLDVPCVSSGFLLGVLWVVFLSPENLLSSIFASSSIVLLPSLFFFLQCLGCSSSGGWSA